MTSPVILVSTVQSRSAGRWAWSLAVVSHSLVTSGQQADGDARRTGLDVDPERHPGEDDDEQAGQVDLDDEVADVARQYELYFKARKRP